MIRVHVAHTADLFRSALAALLRGEHSFDVTSGGWPGPGHRPEYAPPDVHVIDVECPGACSLLERLAGGARSEGAEGRLLVLAPAGRPGLLRRAYEARALGFVDKNGPAATLAQAVRAVARGERFVDGALASGVLRGYEMPLTPRELSVLTLAAEGNSVADIALNLRLSNGTVRNYIAAATRKVGARNRIDAIRISQGAGWM
ncbi:MULTISPECIES: DNA-binding response regulator [Streptomyces]|uniref:response regulator transcription factor n=1 Tax=Streptomyces TaxID=1883 RepID=UPI000697A6F5|nr:response regulator transcription factor [Streptomyces sp. SCSIO ZS0520]